MRNQQECTSVFIKREGYMFRLPDKPSSVQTFRNMVSAEHSTLPSLCSLQMTKLAAITSFP